ncbi:tetratricopeptide repeat protein [Marilutibacter aestuarii]|nr:tetratricopeptide repeat protein [Lysobacter aestuarii]
MAPQFRFGDYLLDPAKRELRHQDMPVAVPPKAFDCLVYLVVHRERAVGRDELIAAVWERVEITDALLGQTLLRARRAVGDSGKSQHAILTVPRFGYRWVAEIEVLEEEIEAPATQDIAPPGPAPSQSTPLAAHGSVHASMEPAIREARPSIATRIAPVDAAPATGGTARRPWRTVALLGVLMVVALVVLVVWRQRDTGVATQAPGSASEKSLVLVMPATLDGVDVADAWMELGVMDFVSSRLHTSGGMNVVPQEQVTEWLRSQDDLASGAQAFERLREVTGASRIVQPEVERLAAGWEVRLADTHGGEVRTWSGRGAAPLEAAAQAVHAMLVDRGGDGGHVPTQLAEWVQRIDASLLAGDLASARRFVDTTPEAWRSRPELRLRMARLDYLRGETESALSDYQALTGSVDPLPPAIRGEALLGVGRIHMRGSNFDDAEARFSDAVDVLLPTGNDVLVGRAYTGLGVARAAQGQYQDALAALGQARQHYEDGGDRLGVARVNANLGEIEFRRGQPENAVREYQLALNVMEQYGERSDTFVVQANMAGAHLANLDPAAALATTARAWQGIQDSDNPQLRSRIGDIHAEALLATGRTSEAASVLATLDAWHQLHPEAAPRAEHRRLLVRVLYGLQAGYLDEAQAWTQALMTALRDSYSSDEDDLATRLGIALTMLASMSRDTDALGEVHDIVTAHVGEDASLAAIAQAHQSWLAGDIEAAGSKLERAAATAERDGGRALLMHVTTLQGSLALGSADDARQSVLDERLAPFAERVYRAAWTRFQLRRAMGDSSTSARLKLQVRRLAGERDVDRVPAGLMIQPEAIADRATR